MTPGTELARPKPAVEVQQCPLRAEVGEEIGEELARRKWTWKLIQTWSRVEEEEEEAEEEEKEEEAEEQL